MNDSSPGRTKIFLVENHADTLTYLTRYLELQGYAVRCALDMSSALSALRTEATDVLVSDIGLPDGDGWQLMRSLRSMGQMPLGIAMSGHGMRSDKEASAAAGYQCHLLKPFMPDDLEKAIRQVLSTAST